MTGAEIAETITRWAAQGVTGAIEWREDKRRRLFFFEAGELVALQSNLKSESPNRVSERHPGTPREAMPMQVAEDRLRGALEEIEGQVEVHIGAAAPAREALNLQELLWRVADVLPRPPDRSYPRTRPGGAALLARVPMPEALAAYLCELDGDRNLEDVGAFGPAEPELIHNGVALALLLDAVEANERAAVANVVTTQKTAGLPPAASAPPAPVPGLATPTPAPRRPAPAAVASEDDIGSLIASEIGGDRPITAGSDGYEVVLGQRVTSTVSADEARISRHVARIHSATNHFEVLGVGHLEPTAAIRKAYLALAKDLHPDRWGSATPSQRDEASASFDRVRGAWETLSDDEARERYVAKVIHGEKTDEEKAMDRVREILDAEADFRRGVAELNAGRVVQAHDLFTKVLARVPDEPEFEAHHGYTSFRLAVGRDPQKAEEAFHRVKDAVARKERFDQGHVLLGMMYRALGDEAAARNQFISALKIKPANPDAAREMKRDPTRNPIENPHAAKKDAGGGFFSKLFGKK